MLAVGLNPFNDTMDSSTPIGLGNVVGKRATEWLAEHDMLMKNNDVSFWHMISFNPRNTSNLTTSRCLVC